MKDTIYNDLDITKLRRFVEAVQEQNHILNEFKADFMNIVTCYQTLARVGGKIDKTLTILQNTAVEMSSFNQDVKKLQLEVRSASHGDEVLMMYRELTDKLKSVEYEMEHGGYSVHTVCEAVRELVWRDIHDSYDGRPDKGHTPLNATSPWDMMCAKVAVMVLKEVKTELKKQGIDIKMVEEDE